MRHRAVLFGLLGGAMIYGAFIPKLQVPVIAAGLVAMVSFLLLYYTQTGDVQSLNSIAMADWIGVSAAFDRVSVENHDTPAVKAD